ncbi:hypothetical protein Celaphus_00018272, partial [Cervus elaphus hippelaphus]
VNTATFHCTLSEVVTENDSRFTWCRKPHRILLIRRFKSLRILLKLARPWRGAMLLPVKGFDVESLALSTSQ